MKEELIEKLENEIAICKHLTTKKAIGIELDISEINLIIQALSQSEWISVEDRLPEIGLNEEFEHASEMILLSDGEFTYYGQYESSEEFGSYFIDANGDDFENDGVEITHWMTLPQPPQTK